MATKKKAAKKRAKKKSTKKKQAGAQARTIGKILVPVDLGDASSWRHSLPTAVEQVRAAGAQLHVVTVVPEFDVSVAAVHLPKNFNQARIREAKERLSELLGEQIPDDVVVKPSVRSGNIYREILAEAETIGADLIVMASHRPSLRSYLLGVNAARVVRHAKCSVYVVR